MELKYTYASLEWLESVGVNLMGGDTEKALGSFTNVRKVVQAGMIGGGKPDVTDDEVRAWIDELGFSVAAKKATDALTRDLKVGEETG